MKSERRARSLRLGFVSAAFAFIATSAFAQSTSFVLPHVLEKSGSIAAIEWNVTGGQAVWDWRVDTMPPTLAFTPMTGLFSLYDNADVRLWLADNLAGKEEPNVYTIYSVQKSAISPPQNVQVIPREIRFPACDVNSKDPGGIQVTADCIVTPGKSTTDPQLAKQIAKKQKMWLCSNFRLSIGNLPCGRVASIDSFTWKQKVQADQDGHYTTDPYVEDVQFTLPAGDVAPFQELFRSRGTGAHTPLPLELDYLDADGNVLMSVQMTGEIVGLGLDGIFSDPNDPAAMYKGKFHSKGHVVLMK